MEEEEIGEQPDQLVQCVSDQPSDQPNARRQKEHERHAKLRRLCSRQS
jgi:hypothetical protein